MSISQVVRHQLDAAHADALEIKKEHQRIQGWSSLLERVVHIITGSGKHRVIPGIPSGIPSGVPAATDGEDIYLNTAVLSHGTRAGGVPLTPWQTVVRLKGLVYHELGHILYTPRAYSPLRTALAHPGSAERQQLQYTQIRPEALTRVWNALEDGRMEDVFLRRFGKAGGYFAANVYDLVLGPSRGSEIGEAVLIYGRKHLPTSLRDAARETILQNASEGPEILSAIEVFADPASSWIQQGNAVIIVAESCSPPEDMSHAAQLTGDPEEGQQPDQDNTGTEDQDDDGPEEGETQESGDKPAGSRRSLHNEVRRAREELAKDNTLAQDIESTLKALKAEEQNAPGVSAGIAGGLNFRARPPLVDESLTSHNVRSALDLLTADTAPVIQRRKVAGRLNTSRYIDPHRQIHELDFFDRRENFGVGLDTEILFLFDISGSMSAVDSDTGVTRTESTAGALWAARKAAQDCGIPTSTFLFSDGPPIVWAGIADRVSDTVQFPTARGGTDPLTALALATEHLGASPARHRLLVVLTDGQWLPGHERAYRAQFDLVRDAGIHSITIGTFGADVESPTGDHPNNGHGADIAVNVRNILALPRAVQTAVGNIVRNATEERS